jgi:hypothetical protein
VPANAPSSDDSKSSDESKPSPNAQRPISNFQFPISAILRWAIALVPLTLIAYEAFILQKTKKIVISENVAKREVAISTYNWIDKVDFSQFQALMPLPYYHVGSENIWIDLDGYHYRRMQTTALHTGVPDMGVNMSRTSVGNMIKSVQFTQSPLEPPELLDDLPDNRPIALMINPARWDEVKEKYPHLLSKAMLVFDHPDMKIMSLVPDSVRSYSGDRALEIASEMQQYATFPAEKPWKSYNQPGWFKYFSYDSLNTTEHIFQGKGAYAGNMGDTSWIWNAPLPKGVYNIILWVYVKQDMGMTHEMKIIQNARSDGHEINFRHEGLRFYLKSIVDGWALFDLEFTVYEDNSDTHIFLQKKGVYEPFFLDEVLIKEKTDFLLYRQKPGWVVRNNYWYKMPDR